MNREAWLVALIDALRPKFLTLGAPIPDVVHVSVGFPSTRALSTKKRRIGECWPASGQMFISPMLSDPIEVGDVLVHELIHAILPEGTGHKKPFVDLARRAGLEGKPTATTGSEALHSELRGLIDAIGPYPHPGLTTTGRAAKKQTTRLLKCSCDTCGYTVRITGKWLAKGAPICPTDNIPLTPEEPHDTEPE